MRVSPFRPAPVIDILHGVAVVDAYRWLEDRTLPETQNWIDEQARIHDDYFSRFTTLDSIRSTAYGYLHAESVDQPARVGNSLFFRRRKGYQEQASIYVRNPRTGVDRILVDPAEHGPFASVAILRISKDGKWLAYALKHGGQRSSELHFVDVHSGRICDDFLETGIARGLAFNSDNTGFYYCHEVEAPSKHNCSHEIRFHRFGEYPECEDLLFSVPRTERSRLVLISDDVHLGAILLWDDSSGSKLDFYLASRDNTLVWQPVFRNRTPPYSPVLHLGRIYVISFGDSPNGQILALDETGCEGSIIVPPWNVPIRGLHLSREHLYVSYETDLQTTIHRWTWDGEFLNPLPEQPAGTLVLLPSFIGDSDTLFFCHESFSKAPSILEYSPTSTSFQPSLLQVEVPEEHAFYVERITYTAKDGTGIPMWLVSLAPLEEQHCRPAILTGYGGFGVSMTPRFSVLVAMMLKLGCVFALPNIRGGSEFGKEWYEAGRRRNRQVACDDFLAAADWLCAAGITKPSRLAVFGGSNAGLLVAAAMTQRPTLFRAVLCIAPLLDMLRYERFDDAQKWSEEYGTIEDANDFRALQAYSPYHNIKDGINYPATFFVTGDKDTQCNPSHVRKMAAVLQEREAQHHPILVDYSAERGHSPCLPLRVRTEALTRRVAFLCSELGIDAFGGEGQ